MLVQCVLYLQYVAAFMVAIAQAFSPMDTACSVAYIFVVLVSIVPSHIGGQTVDS